MGRGGEEHAFRCVIAARRLGYRFSKGLGATEALEKIRHTQGGIQYNKKYSEHAHRRFATGLVSVCVFIAAGP